MDMSVSDCPLIAGYMLTSRGVEGGKSSARDTMEQLVDQFIKTNGLGYLYKDAEGNVALMADKKHIEGGVRGTGRVFRVDIQGPHGEHAARIAYQIGDHVNAQIILPLKARVSEEAFKQAFLDSFDRHLVVEFHLVKPAEDIDLPVKTSKKGKKLPLRSSTHPSAAKSSSSKPHKGENSANLPEKPPAIDSGGSKKARGKRISSKRQ